MSQDVARYYTRGVRFPRLVGRLHDGTQVPGGPYTMPQAVGGLVVFVVGEWTRSWWAGSGVLWSHLVVLAVTAVAVVGLRAVKGSGRDPITATLAVAAVLTQPRHGLLNGRRVRIPAPRRVQSAVVVHALPLVAPSVSDDVQVPVPRPALSRPTVSISAVPTRTVTAPPATWTQDLAPVEPRAREVLSPVGRRLAAGVAVSARASTKE